MQESMKRQAVKPVLTIMVETPFESLLKDMGTFLAWFVAAWLAEQVGLPQTYIMGMAIFVVAVYAATVVSRLGWFPISSTVSAPPHDVGEIIEHWLEATADDHEDNTTEK